jgi:hypothetical protein
MRCSIIWGAPFLMNLHPRNKVCRTYAFNSLPNKESSKTPFLSRRFGLCCCAMAFARASLNSLISFKCAAEAVLEEEPLFTVDSTLTVSVVVGRLSFFGTASGGPTSMTLSSSPLLSSPVFAVFLFFRLLGLPHGHCLSSALAVFLEGNASCLLLCRYEFTISSFMSTLLNGFI